jgi:hypothetical protein
MAEALNPVVPLHVGHDAVGFDPAAAYTKPGPTGAVFVQVLVTDVVV